MIPQSYIDEVLARANIVDVIDTRVKLKKAGKNHIACCPFHDEKTPSFSVNEREGFFYCFGCGASGNSIGFIMDYERLEFKDAVIGLGRALGLGDPSPNTKARESLQSRIGKHARLKAQILDDRWLMEIVKAARERGEQISEQEKPLIVATIARLKASQEEIKNYKDVEDHFRKIGLEVQGREEVMNVVCAELQANREQYPPTQWIPRKVFKVDDRKLQAAYNRIEAIEKVQSKL